MLPAYIIEQIRQREKDQAQQQEQPVLQLPELRAPSTSPSVNEEEADRGIVIIDLLA